MVKGTESTSWPMLGIWGFLFLILNPDVIIPTAWESSRELLCPAFTSPDRGLSRVCEGAFRSCGVFAEEFLTFFMNHG